MERHFILKNSIGTLGMEDEALQTTWILLSSGVVSSIIAFIFNGLIFCKLVNSSMHPFKSILISTEDEMKKSLKSLNHHVLVPYILRDMPNAVIQNQKEELIKVKIPTQIAKEECGDGKQAEIVGDVHCYHQDESEEAVIAKHEAKEEFTDTFVEQDQENYIQKDVSDKVSKVDVSVPQTEQSVQVKVPKNIHPDTEKQAKVSRLQKVTKGHQKDETDNACEDPIKHHDDKQSEDANLSAIRKTEMQRSLQELDKLENRLPYN